MNKFTKIMRAGVADGVFNTTVALLFFAAVVCFLIGEDRGHKRGVRDAIAGLYVIDTLSDGTTVVVKKKGASDAK